MQIDFEAWGGRRFLVTVLVHVSITALKWADKLGDDPFVLALLGTSGAFITGVVMQKRIEASATVANSPQ